LSHWNAAPGCGFYIFLLFLLFGEIEVTSLGQLIPCQAGHEAPRQARQGYALTVLRGLSSRNCRAILAIWLAQDSGTWIAVDDCDSQLRYDSRALPPMQGLDEGTRVLYMGTFSMELFPSLLPGYGHVETQTIVSRLAELAKKTGFITIQPRQFPSRGGVAREGRGGWAHPH
jgi:hypothetical protein